MKKIFVMVICIVAAEFVLPFSKASSAATQKIKIVTQDADIGEVDKGKIFDYQIEVRNVGTEDLIIENVFSTCGCLELTDKHWVNTAGGAVEPVTVKPNHSIYITARVDTNKVGGQFEKMIHIVSNDSENKDAAWKVRGSVAAASYAANGSLDSRWS